MPVDRPGKHLELQGAFGGDGKYAGNGRPGILAANYEVHPRGDRQPRPRVPGASQKVSVILHTLEVDPEVVVHGELPPQRSPGPGDEVEVVMCGVAGLPSQPTLYTGLVETNGDLAALAERFADLLRRFESEFHLLTQEAALFALVQRQAQNPAVLEAIADYEARVRENRPYEDAASADEFIARAQAAAEARRAG